MKNRKKSAKSRSLMPCIMMTLLIMVAAITLLLAFPIGNGSAQVTTHVDERKDKSIVISNDVTQMHFPKLENASHVDQAIAARTSPPLTDVKPKATTSKLLADSPLLSKKKDQKFSIHFIHVPKCGGTTMTTALRQVMCEVDPIKNRDCCINPGFCDHNSNRRCSVIKGCINHFPNRPFIFRDMPTVTLFRDPVSRYAPPCC